PKRSSRPPSEETGSSAGYVRRAAVDEGQFDRLGTRLLHPVLLGSLSEPHPPVRQHGERRRRGGRRKGAVCPSSRSRSTRHQRWSSMSSRTLSVIRPGLIRRR